MQRDINMGVYHWDAVCVVFHESDGMGLISFGIMMIMYTYALKYHDNLKYNL